MKVYHTGDIVSYSGTVVALGEFDGLHLAHMELINRGLEYARKKNMAFGVMCFDGKIGQKTGKGFSKMLIEPAHREAILSDCDFVYIQSFVPEFRNLSPKEFCGFLKHFLKAEVVFAGFNYRFGREAVGTTDMLSEFEGFETHIIEEQKKDGETVSSTIIRGLIAGGNVEKANKLLGRNYSLCGIVEEGKKNGRRLGFPTANLQYNPEMVIPDAGVYAGYTYVSGKKYRSVVNVGNNPTFNANKLTIESYIFDFSKDIYGQYVRVEFVKKLRPEKKFESLKALSAQIQSDKENTVKLLDIKERNDCNNE